ncbi:MAG: dipeptidase [Candidatus Acidiferrales bacterium]
MLAIDTHSEISGRARDIHRGSIVIDTHVDTTQRLFDPSFDFGSRQFDGGIDLPRLGEGGVSAIFFAAWVPAAITGPEAVRCAVEQIKAVNREVARNASHVLLARSVEDIRRAQSQGRIAVLIGIEGGHMIDCSLDVLRRFASLGARYMTLTHLRNTEWADASTDAPVHNGLSDFGKQVIVEMNRLGMIVDVSHASDKTLLDVLDVSHAPVFASHSSCKAICNTPRNLSDDLIRALAAKNGLVQINFHVGFLSQEFADAQAAHPEVEKEIDSEVTKRCGEIEARKLVEWDKIVREKMARGEMPCVYWTEIVEHIDRVAQIAGIDCVGLGSDFDGACMPIGMEDASHLPQITEALLRKGYADSEVRKVLGENMLRLMQDVYAASQKNMKGSAL